jgi:hypothetical protein
LVGGARSPLTTKSHPDPYNGIKKGVISHPKPAFGRFWVLRGIYCYFEGQNVQGTMFNSIKKKHPIICQPPKTEFLVACMSEQDE